MARSLALAAGLLLVVAAPAAAAKPDIYRDSGTDPMAIDWGWTEACGVEVQSSFTWSATSYTFSDGSGELIYRAQRTLVGPEGTVLRKTSQQYGGPFEAIEDPDAGTVTESFQSTTTGVHTFIELGGGTIATDVGLAYLDATIVWGPGDEFSITIQEEFVRGQSDGLSDEQFVEAICGVIAG
jgi:hypothetical protein